MAIIDNLKIKHLEDLVFMHGVAGVKEAMAHLLEITRDSSNVRLKWDGAYQLFWGREHAGGPVIVATISAWQDGSKPTCKEELYEYMTHHSGFIKSAQPFESKIESASELSNNFSVFVEAMPDDFVGFIYCDVLFTKKPPLEKTRFKITPNNRTYYTVPRKSKLGMHINKAKIMLAAHGILTNYGEDTTELIIHNDFSAFNTKKMVVLDPIYAKEPLKPIDDELANLLAFVDTHAETLDGFLAPIACMPKFKSEIYNYTCRKAIQKRLYWLGDDFLVWCEESKISNIQIRAIKARMAKYPQGLVIMTRIMKYIIILKNHIINQLEIKFESGMRVYISEGWIRVGDKTKQFGDIKLVLRHKWKPRLQYYEAG